MAYNDPPQPPNEQTFLSPPIFPMTNVYFKFSFCNLKVKSANIHNRVTQQRLGILLAGAGYSFV